MRKLNLHDRINAMYRMLDYNRACGAKKQYYYNYGDHGKTQEYKYIQKCLQLAYNLTKIDLQDKLVFKKKVRYNLFETPDGTRTILSPVDLENDFMEEQIISCNADNYKPYLYMLTHHLSPELYEIYYFLTTCRFKFEVFNYESLKKLNSKLSNLNLDVYEIGESDYDFKEYAFVRYNKNFLAKMETGYSTLLDTPDELFLIDIYKGHLVGYNRNYYQDNSGENIEKKHNYDYDPKSANKYYATNEYYNENQFWKMEDHYD